MRDNKIHFLSTLLLISIVVSACNMPQTTPPDLEQTALIETAVAQTVIAEQNGDSPPAANPTETGEVVASETPDSDQPDSPTPTDTATPTETPLPCNLARFVKDVNVPDGKKFDPNQTFTKTWRIKNVGSCAWTSGYDMFFDGGDSMGAPAAEALTSGTVNPGDTVDISVDLTAPEDAGTYRGNWKLRDPSDVVFGIENSSSGYFWVEIKVVEPEVPIVLTETLQRDSAHSKTISVGGASSDTRLGIAPNGDPLRAFIDFDLSEADDLGSSSTINQATLDLTNFSGAGCFEFLHPLKVYQVSYGANPDYPADFNSAPIGTIASASSEAGINSPIDVKSELQAFVSNHGAGHFQIRMELEHDDSGSAFACIMEWPNPVLDLTYTN